MGKIVKFWLWVMLGALLIFVPALLVAMLHTSVPNWVLAAANPITLVGVALAIAIAIIVFKVYFYPTALAKGRNHPQKEAIFVLNLALGWTFVGWVIALVWANTNQKQ